MRNNETTLDTLHRLRKLGIRIAMDDFGTGFSSLSYLRQFPFDKIKIDQSFVRGLSRRRNRGAIVRTVAKLAASFRMTTTAEGVETDLQRRIVKAPAVPRCRAICSAGQEPQRRSSSCCTCTRRKREVPNRDGRTGSGERDVIQA